MISLIIVIHLNHFVRTGKHVVGASKKKENLLGHFQVNSTYNRLKLTYYWVGMLQDITGFIKACDACQRNESSQVLDHEARNLPISGIFDMIGIDLVFGLPKTSDGFTGLMVVTEYLSKYPFVKPIKTKSALEIAHLLWEYVCLFGPPKVILSDQRKEFNNSLIDRLDKYVGSEHKITSAYHPRTNGQTERFNGTLVNALRKHCENNVLEWPLWLPFILYSYRSRIHSATNMSPFKAMFGVQMNDFNVTNAESFDELTGINLSNREGELKNLVEAIHPKVRETVSKNKEKQANSQDKNQNIRKDLLPKGTIVLLKNDGLIQT